MDSIKSSVELLICNFHRSTTAYGMYENYGMCDIIYASKF